MYTIDSHTNFNHQSGGLGSDHYIDIICFREFSECVEEMEKPINTHKCRYQITLVVQTVVFFFGNIRV